MISRDGFKFFSILFSSFWLFSSVSHFPLFLLYYIKLLFFSKFFYKRERKEENEENNYTKEEKRVYLRNNTLYLFSFPFWIEEIFPYFFPFLDCLFLRIFPPSSMSGISSLNSPCWGIGAGSGSGATAPCSPLPIRWRSEPNPTSVATGMP